MKSFFKELFDYNFAVNQKLIEYLLKHDGPLLQKSVRLMSHIVNVHHVWNSRVAMKKTTVGGWDLQDVRAMAAFDQSNNNLSIGIIENADLETMMQYTNFLGDAYQNSIRDILFHIINHSTYHRAQIATDCREAGIEPLATDYILYKR